MERQRLRILGVLEQLRESRPLRSAAGVDREIRSVRLVRRRSGHRHSPAWANAAAAIARQPFPPDEERPWVQQQARRAPAQTAAVFLGILRAQ